MIDLYTKLSMAIGKSQKDNNELYEAKKEKNWKLEAVIEYATTHSKDKDIVQKCVEMCLAFGLSKTYDEKLWKEKVESIKNGLKKDNKAKEATKVVQQASYDYGCGSSVSYGCGSSRSSRSSSSYGCGSSSSRYGC